MPTVERARARGTRRGEHLLQVMGHEFRAARLMLGLSQQVVADAAGIDRASYSRIERAKLLGVGFLALPRVAAVLGLDLSVALYPSGAPIRDAASADRLRKLVAYVGPPLRYRTEQPLPSTGGRREQRAWDLMLLEGRRRCAVELETRLYDLQAQLRRLQLKRQDDQPHSFLLVIADTHYNRRILREFGDLLPELPRLRTGEVLKMLRAGQLPPTGFILF
jgi:transcriptional regulator with XRE-family HTH domain